MPIISLRRPAPRAAARAEPDARARVWRTAALGRAAALVLVSGAAAAADWTHLAGDPARSSHAVIAPFDLRVRWHAAALADEAFSGRAAPVTYGERVFVSARHFVGNLHAGNRLIAYRASDGQRLWSADIEADVYDSWASPAVDTRNGTVLVAAGARLYSLAGDDGAPRWDCPLGLLVNASPVVSSDLTNDSTPANRAFIVDFGPIDSSTLYAVNVDPFHATRNPYQPGEVAWSAPLSGSSGNSPAYADGVLYVATTGGAIAAFDARDGGPPIWCPQLIYADPPYSHGFFGGLTVAGGFVYAASYDFDEFENDARLFKLDAASGAVVWTIRAERSAAIPIASGARVYLCGGLPGFGSSERLQAFADYGTHAALLWETTSSATRYGGWTHHPLLHANALFVGSSDGGVEFGAYEMLSRIDPARAPGDPGFVTASHAGSGGSPAAGGDGALYSVGVDGLFCFGGLAPPTAAEPAEGAVPVSGVIEREN